MSTQLLLCQYQHLRQLLQQEMTVAGRRRLGASETAKRVQVQQKT
jgi:hypothetical protein